MAGKDLAVPRTDLAEHFKRRFALFDEEREDYFTRICERRQALGHHHQQLNEVSSVRQEVSDLQRRLSEVQVQGLHEQLRALRLAAERLDCEELEGEYRADLRRLLSVARPAGGSTSSLISPDPEVRPPDAPATVPLPGTATEGSRSVLRMVVTPNEESELEANAAEEAALQSELQEEVRGHAADLDELQAQRSEAVAAQDRVAALLQAELAQELATLKEERLRLAGSLEAFLHLRAEHVKSQQNSAKEVDDLCRLNDELAWRAEESLKAGQQELGQIERTAKLEAGNHLQFRQKAVLLERQGVRALCDSLEAAQEENAMKAEQLSSELQALCKKCAQHRQRRRLCLEGLRADLSLVSRKLRVLEGVAEVARERIISQAGSPSKCPAAGRAHESRGKSHSKAQHRGDRRSLGG
mmetsp:Transcript_101293/g.180002  ORF Transcript_101293/g.180002 Transcript_101293/m.180002 type:complete len:413 (-) Transcript_101293:76-1314(-)